jgi:hypothetical protein
MRWLAPRGELWLWACGVDLVSTRMVVRTGGERGFWPFILLARHTQDPPPPPKLYISAISM